NRECAQAANPAVTLVHLTAEAGRRIKTLGVPERLLFGELALRRAPLAHRGAELLLAPRAPALNEHPIGCGLPLGSLLHPPSKACHPRRFNPQSAPLRSLARRRDPARPVHRRNRRR